MRKSLIAVVVFSACFCLTGCKENFEQMKNQYNTVLEIKDRAEQLQKVRTFIQEYQEYEKAEKLSAEAKQLLNNAKDFESKIVVQIKEDYSKEIANINLQENDSFDEKVRKNEELKKIVGKYLGYLSKAKDEPWYSELRNAKDGYENEEKRNKDYAGIEKDIAPVLKDDWKDNLDTASKRYTDISYKFSDNPTIEKERDLDGIRKSLKEVAREVARRIVEKILEKLEDCGDDSIEQLKKQIKLIDKYLPAEDIQIYALAEWGRLKQKKSDISAGLKKNQEEKEFNEIKKNLEEKLASPITPQDKIDSINGFLAIYANKNIASNYVKSLQTRIKTLKLELEFATLANRCRRQIDNSPLDSSEVYKIKEYRVFVNKYINELDKFTQSCVSREAAIELQDDLREQLKLIENKIGNGTWEDVQDKENAYKDTPTQETYTKLKQAISAFREKKDYKQHKHEVSEVEKNYKQDWDNRKQIEKEWKNLIYCTDIGSWKNFNRACQRFLSDQGYAQQGNDIKECIDHWQDLADTKMVNIKFTSVSNLKQWGHVSGDSRILLYRFNTTTNEKVGAELFELKFDNYDWAEGEEYNKLKGRLEFKQRIDLNKEMFEVELQLVSVGNFQRPRTGDSVLIKINLIEVLIETMKGKEFTKEYIFDVNPEETEKGKFLKVTLKFSR